MTRITVDDDLRRKFQDFCSEIEICDEEGHVLARVKPVLDPALYEFLTPMASEEELDRLKQSNEKRYTTQEMLDYLARL